MSTIPNQPDRDDDDLLLAAEAEDASPHPLPEAPEGSHPRIPASVSRRLQDRSAGVEFDPKAVRSTHPSSDVAGQHPVDVAEPTTTAPAPASTGGPSSGRVVAPPVPEPAALRQPSSAHEETAPEPTSPTEEAAASAPAELPAAMDPQQERPTRRSRMAQLPAEERRDRPTALSGGLPQGNRHTHDDSTPAPWGRLAPHGNEHDAALSLGAPAPKPISSDDVVPGQAPAAVRNDGAGTPQSATAPAGPDAEEPRGAFTLTRIVLGVILLLLVIALILLFVL